MSPRRAATGVSLVAVVALGAVAGCKDERRELPKRPMPSAFPRASSPNAPTLAELPPLEPGDPQVDPPGPAGDFAEEIARYTDLRDCVARHRITDPLLAEGVDAIGYDAFVTDACRGVEAAKTRSRVPCSAVLTTAMRKKCEAEAGMATGDETLCPLSERIAGVPEHDVLCLAAARRDVRPCAALLGHDRAACEGLVARDAARCGTPACRRKVERWKNVLPLPVGKPPLASTASVEIRFEDPDAPGGMRTETHALPREAEAGLVLAKRGTMLAIAFGDPLPVGVRGETHGGFFVEVPESQRPKAAAKGIRTRVGVKLPSGLEEQLATRTAVEIEIRALSAEPNTPVDLTVVAVLGPKSAPRRTEWKVTSWVRDVVVVEGPPPRDE